MRELTILFKALADESRLRILSLLLRSGELCVCDIESTMGFTQTKVSRHLAYLKTAGLVNDRRKGLWMLYSIAEPKSEEHRQLLNYLKVIVASHPAAIRDSRILVRNFRKGCCATYTVVNPKQSPVLLKSI